MADSSNDAILDALALIRSGAANDFAGVQLLFNTYNNDTDEARDLLVGSLLAHSIQILRFAANALNVEPDQIIGVVAERIISNINGSENAP